MEIHDSKNVNAGSIVIDGGALHIGDKVYNNYGKSGKLDKLKKSLLAQQINILRQNMISEDDDLYIQLPKQKLVKETLSFNPLVNQNQKDVSDQPIQDIFNKECFDSMLILGAPGAGKSNLLTELGYKIANKTLKEGEGLLPLFLNLTSWGGYRIKKETSKPFWAWLKYEVKANYGIKGEEYEKILLSKQVVFLLDGLDEVAEEKRKDCLNAFNDFIYEHRVPIALTCRRIEYNLLKNQATLENEEAVLRLNGAIGILPITQDQMKIYLKKNKFEGILNDYNNSSKLRKVLNSPLWLSITLNAYKNGRWKSFRAEVKDWKYKLMGYYEKWILDVKLPMWNDKKIKTPIDKSNQQKFVAYKKGDITDWMAWLSFIMNREKLSVFYLERLQPWHLPNRYLKKHEFMAYLIASSIFGILTTIIIIINYGLGKGLACGFAMFLTLISTIYLDKLFFIFFQNRMSNSFALSLTWRLALGLPFGLAMGIVFNLTYGLIVFFLNFFLSFFLSISTLDRRIPKVEIVESISFNIANFGYKDFLMGFIYSLVFGVWGILLSGLYDSLIFKGNFNYNIPLGLFLSLIGFVVYMFATVLTKSTLIVKDTILPNQGIHRTVKYVLLSGLIIILVLSIFLNLPDSILEFSFSGFSVKEFISLAGAIYLVIILPTMGLTGLIRHYLIRYYLKKVNFTPIKYPFFLNIACRLGYLKRVGGGYRFFHREFQEYLYRKYKHKFLPLYKSKTLMKDMFES